jgi:hypothetical protein
MHTRLISVAFSLSLYTTFSHPYSLLKPCGYCTCLIIMKHVQFSPNLYTTWHVLLNDLRDLRKWRKCKSFLLQVDVAGDGSTKTNIKMNTKWIWNTSRSHPTSTPHDTFYVIISVTFEREGHSNWPFLPQVDVAELGMGLQKPISKWISNG